MTLHDVGRLFKHWRREPPLRALVTAVAASVGVKIEPKSEKPAYMTAEEAQAMIRVTGGRIDGLGRL